MNKVKDRPSLENKSDYRNGLNICESMPKIVFVELTQNCNLNCKMCRPVQVYDKRLDMSPELYQRLVDDIFPSASIVDLRGWGESTILKAFPWYLQKAVQSGATIRLVTNGIAITERVWRQMFEGDNFVVISVDAACPEKFKSLGRGDFHRVVGNIKTGVKIRDELGRGQISFNSVVSSENLYEIPKIISLAANLGISSVVLFPIIARRETSTHLSHAVSRIPDMLDEAARVARANHVRLQLGASLDESLTVEYGLPRMCTHPWSYSYIDYKGNVGFCDHLLARNEFYLGSIIDTPFNLLWNGSKAQRLRKEHINAVKSRKFSEEFWPCEWCYHNRYTDFEHIVNPEVNLTLVSSQNGLPLYVKTPPKHEKPISFIENRANES